MEAIQAILLGEVREAIQRLPLKAAGYDDLPAELFKLDDDGSKRSISSAIHGVY